MKKLLFPLLLLILTSCEVKNDWLVTTTLKIEQWNTISVKKVNTTTTTSSEVVLDMSEKEIKEYCAPSYYSEQYGTTLYKYFTTKTYIKQ